MIITDIFNSTVFIPLYNALVFITNYVPGGDLGISVILLTILVKLLILPISHKSIKTQSGIKKVEPEVKKLKEKYKDSQQEQAQEIMKLYKEHGINPFSGCLLTILQIPIIFGLYWVFWRGLSDGIINPDILYSFVSIPETVNFYFLNILDLNNKSIILAFMAGISQFYLMKLSIPPIKKEDKEKKSKSFADELKKGMGTQMRYMLPLIIGFVSLSFPSVVPLYWSTSNLFSIGHELIVKRKAFDILSKTEAP